MTHATGGMPRRGTSSEMAPTCHRISPPQGLESGPRKGRTIRTEEQSIGILQEYEAGAECADLCRKHGMSEGTFDT